MAPLSSLTAISTLYSGLSRLPFQPSYSSNAPPRCPPSPPPLRRSRRRADSPLSPCQHNLLQTPTDYLLLLLLFPSSSSYSALLSVLCTRAMRCCSLLPLSLLPRPSILHRRPNPPPKGSFSLSLSIPNRFSLLSLSTHSRSLCKLIASSIALGAAIHRRFSAIYATLSLSLTRSLSFFFASLCSASRHRHTTPSTFFSPPPPTALLHFHRRPCVFSTQDATREREISRPGYKPAKKQRSPYPTPPSPNGSRIERTRATVLDVRSLKSYEFPASIYLIIVSVLAESFQDLIWQRIFKIWYDPHKRNAKL